MPRWTFLKRLLGIAIVGNMAPGRTSAPTRMPALTQEQRDAVYMAAAFEEEARKLRIMAGIPTGDALEDVDEAVTAALRLREKLQARKRGSTV